MDLINFDIKDKSKWGDLQARNSDNIRKGMALKSGFINVFVRKGTENCKKIMAMLQRPTSDQRGYYWSVVLPSIRKAAEDKGQCYESDEELHCDIKREMMKSCGVYIEKVSKLDGEVYREPISVSNDKGSRENTAKYLDAVINWAAEFYEVIVPEPIIINKKGE